MPLRFVLEVRKNGKTPTTHIPFWMKEEETQLRNILYKNFGEISTCRLSEEKLRLIRKLQQIISACGRLRTFHGDVIRLYTLIGNQLKPICDFDTCGNWLPVEIGKSTFEYRGHPSHHNEGVMG